MKKREAKRKRLVQKVKFFLGEESDPLCESRSWNRPRTLPHLCDEEERESLGLGRRHQRLPLPFPARERKSIRP